MLMKRKYRNARRPAPKTVLILLLVFFVSCALPGVPQSPRPQKVALVLGAGASRGFAHIGVLKVLEANGVPVNMVVGTSAGSFVGSLYAYGFSAFEVQKMALSIAKTDIVDLVVPDNGFVKGERLEGYINALVRNAPIEKMKIPFYAVATSMPEGSEVIFGRGNTGTAVRASCAIPGVFRPVKIGDAMYIDGGVVSPVAVSAAKKQGADVVIAVDISADIDNRQPATTVETILQAVTIMYARLAQSQTSKADVLIRPRVGHISSSDFDKRHEAILEGEKAALQALPAIRSIMVSLGIEGRAD